MPVPQQALVNESNVTEPAMIHMIFCLVQGGSQWELFSLDNPEKRTNAYCWLPGFSDSKAKRFVKTMTCLLFTETWRYFIIEFEQIYQMFHPTVLFWQVYKTECWLRLINQAVYESPGERIQYICLKPMEDLTPLILGNSWCFLCFS